MNFQEMKTLEETYVAQTYGRLPLDVAKGSGAKCESAGGKEYIDFSSGIGVNSMGFTNPAWVKAVKDQIDQLSHISNLYYTQPMIKLAEALCKRTGMKRVFFANSGAEANEGAIKAARLYGEKKGPACNQIITLVNSFHGRTIATLAATGQDTFHKHFGPFPDGFVYAEANNVADLTAKVSDKVCAIMVECIQGEGGVVPLEAEFLAAIGKICAEKDILLITDEIQTGVGRTGKFLCGEFFGLKPDIITLAKGLGGGLPIGAVLFGEKTQDTLGKGDHGSTFGGNPVCCAGALAVLEEMDQAYLDDVAAKGDHLVKRLEKMQGVKSVTGKGLMLGAELQEGYVSGEVMGKCAENGLIVLTAKHKLRFLPPLTITMAELDKGLDILEATLAQMKQNRR